MLYVTHDHNEARFMGDQVLVIDQGRVVQIGPPEMIFARPVSRFVAHFTATRNILPGQIIKRCGVDKALVEVAGVQLFSTSFPAEFEDVWVCIRPEHFSFVDNRSKVALLHLSEKPVASESTQTAADNFISGYRISQIIPQSGATVMVELKSFSERLLVLASNRRIADYELNVGNPVNITVAAEQVHCLPRQPDDIYCRPE